MEVTGVPRSCLICGDTNLLSNCAEEQDLISKFAEQLGLQGQVLAFPSRSEVILCDDCKAGVVRAGEVERKVRNLQGILLNLQDNYLKEITRLQEKMRMSGKHVLEVEAIMQGIRNAVGELGGFQGCSQSIHHLASGIPPPAPVTAEPLSSPNFWQPISSERPNVLPLPQQNQFDNNAIKLKAESSEEMDADSEPDPFFTYNNDVEHAKKEPEFVSKEGLSCVVASPAPLKRTRKVRTCEWCGRTFGTMQNLTYHIYTHTGQRPYLCPLCPGAFRTSYHLKDHLRRHSGEMPFTCPYCQKPFGRKSEVRRHLKIHTRDRVSNDGTETRGSNDAVTRSEYDISKIPTSQGSQLHAHGGTSPQASPMSHVAPPGPPLAPFACQTCGHSFIDGRSLQNHLNYWNNAYAAVYSRPNYHSLA